jgi:ATP-binding cassette subfamily B protein/subfamily B ATP-binding cassette protein MsbA
VGAYFRPDLTLVVGAVLLLGVNLTASLLKPWPLAMIVDHLLAARDWPRWMMDIQRGFSREGLLVTLCGVLLALYLIQAGVAAAQNYWVIKIGLRGLARIRQAVFCRLQRLSVRFYQGTRQGDVIYRASWDTYAFQTLFQQGLFGFLSATLSLTMMVLVMWHLNRRLTLVALSTVPLLLLAMRVFGRKMSDNSLQAHQADSRVTSFIQQNITSMTLIQSDTQEASEERRFSVHVGQALRSRLTQHGSEVGYLAVIGVIFGLGMAGIVWLGAGQVSDGRLSVGELLVFLAYLAQFYEPLNQLSRVGSTVSDASAGVKRVLEILDTPEEVVDPVDGRAVVRSAQGEPPGNAPGSSTSSARVASRPLTIQGSIEFDQVAFGYQKDRTVLRGISFRLKAGESLAVVGPSGVGKSTLLHLIPRFFDPDVGYIRMDGEDLRGLRLKDLRQQIAFLMQEPLLIAGSVRENISFGCPEASMQDILEASQASQADTFIRSLPKQYETALGDGATRLSAGEKQRLNLARAFLKNAPILLLDEPTSALDFESERRVLESLRALMVGRTTLIVGHQPSILGLARKVVVLENGSVTAEGELEEVANRNRFLNQLLNGPSRCT